jgi:hypothetical protein
MQYPIAADCRRLLESTMNIAQQSTNRQKNVYVNLQTVTCKINGSHAIPSLCQAKILKTTPQRHDELHEK